jgi:hypothetical protein
VRSLPEPPPNPVGVEFSVSFDGTGDYVAIPYNSSQDLINAFTIEGWLRVNSFDVTWDAVLGRGENSWRLHRDGDSERISFHSNAAGGLHPFLTPQVDLADGQWHHFAITSDGTNRYFLIDGVIEAQDVVY